ncbi:glycosyltransferase family 4 protein [Bradyrhizobium sp. JYMT SZCCT0180]|uniref:glycosyltransferase family 4 protein n=1 Tax=Bradyrhizobium sp. JYMT SZCCT0180 TaxID=2807666 RepID=UPI001BA75338|nr:glycosyltransferase family 4 protein [Bradyrhizobium sp. JYMT SZCCT0180]MBR1213944.1 glycosyltransferase family 4 protein [Bradyrhizobium sp. JYMT SZCCT0180]
MSLCNEKESGEHHPGKDRFAELGMTLEAVSQRAADKAGASGLFAVSSKNPVRDDPASGASPRLFCVAKDRYPAFRVDVTELFSRWLVGAGYRIDWLMARAAPGPSEIAIASPEERTFVLGAGSIRARLAGLRLIGRIAVAILRGEYDIVQARDRSTSSLLFLLLAKLAGRPFVYWMSWPMLEGMLCRARDPKEAIPTWRRLAMRAYVTVGKRVLYNIVLQAADHVFAQSPRMKVELVQRGVAAQKITPVPMGVSVDRFNPSNVAPADDRRLDGRNVLLYMGYMGTSLPGRRIDVILRALGAVVRKGHDAVLVLLGDSRPTDRDALLDLARAEGVADRLIFTGHLPLAQALGYVRRADVCLSPCPVDPILVVGTPTKLVEYLAMGRPVVANDHPDQREVLEASGAGLVTDLSSEGFAEAIAILLSDKTAAESMAVRGPPWVTAHRSYAVYAELVSSVYSKLIRVTPR